MDSHPPVSLPHRRRPLRWIVITCCLCGMAWLGRHVHSRLTRAPTPHSDEYWRDRWAELDPLSPDDALSRDAADCMTVLSGAPNSFYEMNWQGEFKYDSFRDLSRVAVFEQHFGSPGIRSALSTLKRCLRSGWQTSASELAQRNISWRVWSQYSRIARCLVGHAVWRRRVYGDLNGSFDDWLALLRLARQGRRADPGGLIEDYLLGDLAIDVEDVVDCGQFSAGHAGQLMQSLDQIIGPGPDPRQHAEVARRNLQQAIDASYVRDGGWLSVAASADLRLGIRRGTATGGASASRLWNLFSFLYDNQDSARRKAEQFADSLKSMTDLTAYARAARAQNFGMQAGLGPLHGFYRAELNRMVAGIAHHYHACMRLEAAISELALAEFERDHGTAPTTLEELVPQYLPRLPVDYADGRPLRYRNDGRQLLLYSVGADGIDQGGARRQNVARREPWRSGHTIENEIVFMARSPVSASSRPAAGSAATDSSR